MHLLLWITALLILQQSPASQAPPKTVTPQSYPRELVLTGQARFVDECSFCHGRDAAGSDMGPDLTRSILVAQDVRGDKIAPVVRAGRVDKGMPAFDLNDAELNAMVAFIHDQKAKVESFAGGRRNVDVADIQTGNPEAGARYFNRNCLGCHSATGDLAGIGSKYRGLPLLQRMLNPQGTRPVPAPAKVTVTRASGPDITGTLVSRDEFTITLKDESGANRSWPLNEVKIKVDDPVSAHFEQLGKYTDEDMHNVYAYLQTLR
ncbi:MAG TPA: c-type cytochrome [Terriglobia bacterium]|nr:c-type cytochrome [Terriglobia bacterium]